MRKNVADMYLESSENNRKLLSDYSSDFWSEYINNYTYYDNLFKKMYHSYVYYYQEDDESIYDVQTDFTSSVYEWLMLNEKRYSELYRLVLVDDTSYHIDKNYDVTKNINSTDNFSRSDMYGQHTDVGYNNTGEQSFTGLNKRTGWDNSTENTDTSNDSKNGSRQDTSQITRGAQNNTSRSLNTGSSTERNVGVIGGVTQSEMLNKHVNTWKSFNFYKIIFDEICTQFLLVE